MTKTTNLADEFLDIIGTGVSADIKGWLSTGCPQFNKIISGSYDGGFAYGRMYEVFGPSSSGKTVIATSAMIEAQKANGAAIFVDFERAYMQELAVKLGLDLSRYVYIKPKSWEQGMTQMLQIAERMREKKMVPPEAPIVIVVDSIASAVPKSVLEKEMTEHTMNDTTALARATSNTLKVVAGRTEEQNITTIFLNQIRLKPGVMFGDPTTTPGGGAMEFYASARLSISRSQLTKQVDGKKQVVGAHITAKCVKSKHTRPFQTAAIDFLYRDDESGSGYFDVTGSLIDHLVELGKLDKSGNFIVWTDGKKYPKKSLVEKIESEGLTAELNALLPKSE